MSRPSGETGARSLPGAPSGAGGAMLRRVLVATDGSGHAQRAEAFAGQLAAGAEPPEIELLYVYPQLPPRNFRPDPDIPWRLEPRRTPPYIAEQAECLLQAAVSRVRDAAGRPDMPVRCRFVMSCDVAGWIVHEADRSGADLIVMGGRHHGGLS